MEGVAHIFDCAAAAAACMMPEGSVSCQIDALCQSVGAWPRLCNITAAPTEGCCALCWVR